MTDIQEYLQAVNQIYQGQNATDHTYRPALKKLIESFDAGIQSRRKSDVRLDEIHLKGHGGMRVGSTSVRLGG
jgi:hypothetical protein